jgi:hypothetical protein
MSDNNRVEPVLRERGIAAAVILSSAGEPATAAECLALAVLQGHIVPPVDADGHGDR